MKAISTALAQHLAGEVATLATCWNITRRDSVVLRFTYASIAIRGPADLAVDNLNVESVFFVDGITEEPCGPA